MPFLGLAHSCTGTQVVSPQLTEFRSKWVHFRCILEFFMFVQQLADLENIDDHLAGVVL